MKVVLTIVILLGSLELMVKNMWKISDPLLLKGLLISLYRTFSLNWLRLQQTKKYTRAIFLQEKVSEIYRLNQRSFSVFLSIADQT